MAEMHAIEEANRQADLARPAIEFAWHAWMILMVPELVTRRQFQKWNHAFLQFGSATVSEHVFERHRVGHIEFAGITPAQSREVRAAAELLAELVGDAADVGALGAGHAKRADRLCVVA